MYCRYYYKFSRSTELLLSYSTSSDCSEAPTSKWPVLETLRMSSELRLHRETSFTSAQHTGGPGSIPGVEDFLTLKSMLLSIISKTLPLWGTLIQTDVLLRVLTLLSAQRTVGHHNHQKTPLSNFLIMNRLSNNDQTELSNNEYLDQLVTELHFSGEHNIKFLRPVLVLGTSELLLEMEFSEFSFKYKFVGRPHNV